MKATILASAAALAIAPAITTAATAASAHGGAWTFTDYTPDPTSLAADVAFHTVTGTTITSYCHDSRVPSAPQDVNSRLLKVSRPGVLTLHLDATGAWGFDVATKHGVPLAGITTTRAATDAASLAVPLRPGQYVVQACNLGGGPIASVDYQLHS